MARRPVAVRARVAHASARRARRWAMKALYMAASRGSGAPSQPAVAEGAASLQAWREAATRWVDEVVALEAAVDPPREDLAERNLAEGKQSGRPARATASLAAATSAGAPEEDLPRVADAAARERAIALVAGTLASLSDVDAVLAAVAQDWPLEHMAAVDRAILRLAAHELLHTDTPAPIVINDAIELARRYSTKDSPRFVNGVLGALAPSRSVRPTLRGTSPVPALHRPEEGGTNGSASSQARTVQPVGSPADRTP